MASSKTARRSMPTTANGKFQADATASRIISLAKGQGAYLLNAEGKTKRYDVATDAFIEALVEMSTSFGADRVARDLAAANFPQEAQIESRLAAALAPAQADAE